MRHDPTVTIIGELGSIRTDLRPHAPASQPARAGNAARQSMCPRKRANRAYGRVSLV
jgi:hypothetical protein